MVPTAAPPLLLGLLLLVPLVAAQTDAASMRVTAEPFPGPVPPLKGLVTARVTVDAPCLAPGADPTRARLDLWLTGAPAWSTVVVSPASLDLDPTACQGGRLVHEATLSATTTDLAPAFAPASFKVHAAWAGATPNLTAEDDVDVAASYFSILDVQLAQAIQTVEPGAQATFPVTVTNLGNGDTKVFFELVEATPGFVTQPPPPLVLQSRQAGGSAISAEVPIVIEAPTRGAFTSESGTVTYRIRSHHATDEALAGDSTTLSLLVTAKGVSAPTPAPGPLPLLALGAVVAVALAGRRTR